MYDILRRCPLFLDLTDSEIEDTLAFYKAQRKKHSKGEFVLKAGQPVSRFGLLLSGTIQMISTGVR